MGVGIVFVAVVLVLVIGFFRSQFFKQYLVILVESPFVVVNEDTGRDMHGVDQDQALPDTAFIKAVPDLGRNVDKSPSGLGGEGQFFPVRFHGFTS